LFTKSTFPLFYLYLASDENIRHLTFAAERKSDRYKFLPKIILSILHIVILFHHNLW